MQTPKTDVLSVLGHSLRASLFGLALCVSSLSASAQSADPSQANAAPEATAPVADVDPQDTDTSPIDVDALMADLAADPRLAFFKEWQATARRAETLIDAARASNAAFEALRQELVEYRLRFQQARNDNEARIASLTAQTTALGEPRDGEEPATITALRNELQARLDELKVPRIVAELAYSRAQGLITEIDRLVRDRATRTLLERGPSPLNPELWPTALADLSDAFLAIGKESATRLQSRTVQRTLLSRAPALLFLTGLALVLLLRGRAWAHWAGGQLRKLGGEGAGVWRFVVSLLQVLLPYVGTVLLVRAVHLSDVTGLRGTLLLDDIPMWSFLLFASHWLGERLGVFQIRNELVPAGTVRGGRVALATLATLLVLHMLLDRIAGIESLAEESFVVLAWPLILLSGLVLWQFLRRARVRSDAATDAGASDEEDGGLVPAAGNRALTLMRRLVMGLALLAPVLGAAGYVNAAMGVIYPTALTVGLVLFLMVVQCFVTEIYGWLTRTGQAAQDTLFAGLVGIVLVVLSLPALALIWGARVADLTELWSRFLEGFTLGDTQISPAVFLTFAVIFAAGFVITRLVQSSLRTTLLPKTKIDPGGQNAIVAGTGYIGIFLAALIAISMAGLDLSSLAIVAGALSVGIGFGLQTIVSNFVSGIILLIERPISKGDWIEVGGQMGYVRDISVRSTRIETFDRTDVIVPNSDLISGTVTNYTRGNTVGRVIVPVGVAYGTDPRRVETILGEIAKAHPMVLMRPPPSVVFQGFGADSLDFEIRAILRDVNWVLSVKSDLNFAIAKRFDEAGIEIPFAQRDIWIRNAEVLRPPSDPSGVTQSEKESEA